MKTHLFKEFGPNHETTSYCGLKKGGTKLSNLHTQHIITTEKSAIDCKRCRFYFAKKIVMGN